MLRNLLRTAAIAVALAALWHVSNSQAHAGNWFGNVFHRDRSEHMVYSDHMFSNYYVGPSYCAGGIPAQLYVAPVPTPPLVGHTYITYEPLRPHEMLYPHRRTYFRHNPGEGWSHTRVRYR